MVVESSIVDCSAVRILRLVGQRFLLLRRSFEAGGEREGEREDIADEPSPLIDDDPPLLNTISGGGRSSPLPFSGIVFVSGSVLVIRERAARR